MFLSLFYVPILIKGSAAVHHFPCLHRQDWLFVSVGWKYSCVALQPVVNFNRGDVPQKVNHCTAFNDRYYVFLIFSVNK